jgi:hypothetical protein
VLFLESTHAIPGLPSKDGVSKYVSVVTSKCFKYGDLEVVYYYY